MFRAHRFALLAALVLSTVLASNLAWSQSPKALTEEKIVKLVELGVEESVIVGMLQKDGIAFDLDASAAERLKKAGVSDPVLAATRKAAAPKPIGAPEKAITYRNVLDLVQLGVPEGQVLKKLKGSPTLFTLDSAQVEELKKAGASDAVIAAMQGKLAAPASTSEITDFAIILDCSGSMAEPTKEGPTKMAVAKRVVTELIQKIPNGLNLSLIIYGHDKAQTCQAVKVVRPMSPLDQAAKAELARVIDRLQPSGSTPIALALKAAGVELARNQSPSGLVLISDGKETCNGSPSAEAATLARDLNLSFGANVIGFDVQDDERAALDEIARAGKGKYYNAESAAEFREVVQAFRKNLEVAIVAPPAAEPEPEPVVTDPVVQATIEQLWDKDWTVRMEAAVTLRKMAAKEAGPALAKRVADEQVEYDLGRYSDKWQAIDALRAVAPEKAAPALLAALNAKNTNVPYWAVMQMGYQGGDATVVAALVRILASNNGNMRREAAISLGRLVAKDAAPALARRIADEQFDYDLGRYSDKNAAVDALKVIAPEMVTPALIAAMKAKNRNVKSWATSRIGDERKK